MPQQPIKPLRLLESVPNKVYNRLIVRYRSQSDDEYALSYRFAAKRLGETFTGEPIDDLILLPFLTLYRQAFELQLKNLIRFLVNVRITYVEGRTRELDEALSEKRFTDDLGHNLHKLLNEVKKHYDTLDLDPFPKDVEKLIMLLHEADKSGTAFRYAGQLPKTEEHADFPDLAALLDQQYDTLAVVTDYVGALYSAGPTLNELAGDAY